MDTTSERLEHVLKTAGMTQVELAQRLGVSQQAISRVCTGFTKNSKLIVPICQELGANPTWVLSGEGNAFQKGELKKQPSNYP